MRHCTMGDHEQVHQDEPQDEEQYVDDFNPSWRFHAAFAALAFTNLLAALDATMLSVAIPVRALVYTRERLILNDEIRRQLLKACAALQSKHSGLGPPSF